MYRTHTCGELDSGHAGSEATLCGWVARRRDHGKLIFIDIRDRTGYTQVVFIPKVAPGVHELAQTLRSEFVVKIRGQVNARPKGMINDKIPTGEIELMAQELEIINTSETPPFEIEDNPEVTEETRLKYRYLDLRREQALRNLKARSRLYKAARRFLDEEGFYECETPVLTKSTPEGARDYLVPSRLSPHKFYALPQSPQLFKQILMVSGIERYYQIAKCFRDEDLRADRQPEFTQLDMEMSFVSEEEIFTLTERLMQAVVKELKGVDLAVPFPRISFAEAQEKYGTDKPDTRKETGKELSFLWVVDFPLFKYNEEEKRWESEHHPFTSPRSQDMERLESDPGKVISSSYDLVLNGNEIASGSVRIHDRRVQERIFRIIGIDEAEARERFGFLLEAFQYGAPPHGGIAFGLDRLLSIFTGQESIREVILFPKTSAGLCPLTGAPSGVDDRQLREIYLDLRKLEK
ncbi:MAG: aspartate--tRNA ligase [Candidatus Omnitrophica bacterium]|nr:aspartate--tRNA ligase [Candidatus Omnitrophota bacterium]